MNSELLSHLGKMFGKIFRVQLSKKSPKSGIMCFTKIYPGPCKGAADGPCKGAVGPYKGAAGPCKGAALPQGPYKGAAAYMLLLPAAPLQAPCGTLARTRRHPCKDPALCSTLARTLCSTLAGPGYILVKHIFPLFGDF